MCKGDSKERTDLFQLLVINAIAAKVADYCLTQFMTQVKKDVAQHKAEFKKFCIPAVLFLSTYQDVRILLLVSLTFLAIS
jgi:hypothetical protein